MPGYLVFGTGQPTKLGFQKVLEYLLREDSEAKTVLWTNMRQVSLLVNLANKICDVINIINTAA